MKLRTVLIGTTHPGNIGATARAMKNMGLHDLALVRPRVFPHEDATARASGATDVLQSAQVFDSLDEAIAECSFVVGTSARARTIGWPTLPPRQAAGRLLEESGRGLPAMVFGPEKSGMSNEDLDRCHALLTIPTNPDFSSLNLAMAVQVLAYELRMAALGTGEVDSGHDEHVPLATGEQMTHFHQHLERVLTALDFLDPNQPRQLMRRLRRLFARAAPDQNEINILRGILAAVERDDPRR